MRLRSESNGQRRHDPPPAERRSKPLAAPPAAIASSSGSASSSGRDASSAASSNSASSTPGAGPRRCTASRFSVSVPVLSLQITVVEPSVSTAASRRTIAPCSAIWRMLERERDRHHRRQALGQRRDRQRHADEHAVGERVALEVGEQRERRADARRDRDQQLGEMVEPDLERRPRAVAGRRAGDPAHLGLRARGRDHEAPQAAGHRRAGQHPGPPLGGRRVGGIGRVGALAARQGLPRERRLVDLQQRRLEQPAVRRDAVARSHRDDVPGDELGRRGARARDPRA